MFNFRQNLKNISVNYLQIMNNELDSLKNNVNNYWEHTDKTSTITVNINYNLEVIQVPNIHMTAKIIKKNLHL